MNFLNNLSLKKSVIIFFLIILIFLIGLTVVL